MGIEGTENLTHTHIEQDQPVYDGTGDGGRDKPLFQPEKQEPVAPLDQEYLDSQQAAEDKKQSELDKARELHNRVTAGEDPEKVRDELGGGV